MSNERKTIRDSIKEIIESVVDFKVYTSRRIDARDASEFINVYFENGDIDYDGLQSPTTASIVVAYNTDELVDDDQLDMVSDSIYEALGAADIAPNLIQGFIPTGFEYIDDRERGFSGIYLRYSVTY